MSLSFIFRFRHRTQRAACGAFLALLAGTLLPAQAQTLRWASKADAQTMDPHGHVQLLGLAMNRHVNETLIYQDANGKLLPGLASEWTRVSPTLWRLKLRAGVKFHDGSPFTADDVVFSVKRAQGEASMLRVFAVPMGEPRRVDDLTVEFTQPQFNPVFLEQAVVIGIMNKAWTEKNNAQVPADLRLKETRYTTLNANGTGPFTLVSRVPDTRTTYKRNPNWWGKFDGNVQEVVHTPIDNDSTRSAALLSGEVDLVQDPPQQDIARLRENQAVNVVDGVVNRIMYIGMDQGRDELLYSDVKGKNPFKDIRVRRALYQAIDTETLRTRVLNGQALPTGSMTQSALAAYNDAELERRLPYDLARARALLTEAGYPQGFEVTLDCGIQTRTLCLSLATMWAQIGVKIKANIQPPQVFLPKGQKFDISLYVASWGAVGNDAEGIVTPLMRHQGTGGVGAVNWGGFKNAKLDQLAADSSKEIDPAKREQLVKAALREQQEQIHYIPLFRPVIPWAMRKNVNTIHTANDALVWNWTTVAPKP
jgi:peptide/nickel transport system substrate-binding protein